MSGVLSEARYVLITRLTLPAFSFVLLIWIGRHSDALLGQYALATTFYFVMQTLPLLGLTPLVLRETARTPERAGAIFGTVGLLALFACTAINAVAYYALPHTAYSETMRQAVTVVGWAIVPGILGFLSELILISLHRARWVAYTAVSENVLRLVASVVVLQQGGGVVELMWVLLATRGIVLFSYLAAGIRDRLRLWPRFDAGLLGKIREVLPVFLAATILALILSRLDYFVLAHFQDEASIGHYAIAYRLLEIVQMAVSAVLMALFPRFSRLFSERPQQFRAAARLTLLAALTGFILLAFLGILWADTYVSWLFSRQYPHPVLLAQGFVALIVIIGIDLYLAGLLNAADRQADDLRAQFVGASLYVALLFALIPPLGGYGALLALGTATSAQLLARLFYYRRRVGPLHCRVEIAWLIGSGGLLLAWASFGLAQTSLPILLLTSLLVIALFPLLLFALGLGRLGRALVLHWPRCRPEQARPPETLVGCLDHLACDLRAWCRWRARALRGETRRSISNYGPLTVMLYRLARYCWLNQRTRLARIINQISLFLTKAELLPWVHISPGLVLTHTCGTIVVGHLGPNSILGAWCALGGRGNADVGAGPGVPSLLGGAQMGHRAVAHGPVRCEERMVLPPHVWITHKHQWHAVRRRLLEDARALV